MLRALARQVVGRLELRRQAAEFSRANAELRAAEQALSGRWAIYHSLVENLPLYVFRKDLAGRFTFANCEVCDPARPAGRRGARPDRRRLLSAGVGDQVPR